MLARLLPPTADKDAVTQALTGLTAANVFHLDHGS